MPPNETTVLLTNYREKHILSSCRQSYGVNGHIDQDSSHSHVVQVSKDPEYEPIFSVEDYSSALTLAELLPYQDDPWWQKFRCILFSAYWIILLMTLVTACLMSYLQAGKLSCNIVDQPLLSTTAMSLIDATTVGNSLPPVTITEIITSQILATGGKLAAP